MQYKNKLASAIATAALLTNTVVPAFAAVDGSATNNTTGADSYNKTAVEVVQDTSIVQNNSANINNNVNFKMNTGDNTASKNTGVGEVVTGDVSMGVALSNKANTNIAEIAPCGGCDISIDTSNMKTGYDSKNKADVKLTKDNQIFQDNTANVTNDVNAKINTGDNQADKNTTGGYVRTGDVAATTVVENDLNKNWAVLTGGNGSGTNLVSGNSTTGADSKNESEIKAKFSNLVSQSNYADVYNSADLHINTGKNQANKNTGVGAVTSGDVDTGVAFNTIANDNALVFAGGDCCDVEFLTGNEKTGADSKNESEAKLATSLSAFQSNCGGQGGYDMESLFWHKGCEINNIVDGNLNTGDNATNKNTNDDVVSGDVNGIVQVESDTNHNSMGSLSMPDVEWNTELPTDMSGWAWWMMFAMNN